MTRLPEDPRSYAERTSQALAAAGVGIWEWDLVANTMRLSAEWREHVGRSGDEAVIPFAEWRKRLHPDDAADLERAAAGKLADSSTPHVGEYRVLDATGAYRWILVQGGLERDQLGTPVRFRGFHMDITERKRAELLDQCQAKIHEMILRDAPISETLAEMLTFCESQSPGMLGSVLLLDPDGVHLRHGAAPSLPPEYMAAIDGSPIGPADGSCGTAAFRRESVVVEDIATDPLWKNYAATALKHDLRACWSTPIFDAGRRVLGTFAMYYRTPRKPGPTEFALVAFGARMAALAITRDERRQILTKSERRFARLFEAGLTGIIVARLDGTISEANDQFLSIIGYSREDLRMGAIRWDSITPPEWAAADRAAIAEIERTGVATPFEKEYFHKDGHRVPILASVAMLDGNSGDAVCVVVDLTEQKRAEAERINALSRVTDSVIACDTDWTIRYINDAAEVMLQRTRASLLGRNAWTEFPETVDGGLYRMYMKAIAEQVPGSMRDYVPPPVDRWLDVRAYPSPDGITVFAKDITDTVKAESARRISETRFRQLFDSDVVGVLITTVTGTITEANTRFLDLLGISRETFQRDGLDWGSISPPEWIEQHVRVTAEVVSTGTVEPFEKELWHVDGRRIPVLMTATLLDDEPQSAICIVIDLTAQRSAEAERARVLERVSDGFVALDTNWRYTHVNDRAGELFGRDPASLIGKHIWTEFPDGVGQPFHLAYERTMKTQVAEHLEEYYPPFGRWFENRIYPSPDGLSIFFHDITDRKRAEAELQVSEERYRVLVEQSGDVFLMLNQKGEFTFVSPSVRAALGYDPSDLLGKRALDFHHPDDVPAMDASFESKIAEPGKGTRRFFRVRHKNGTWRDIEGYGVSTKSGNADAALVGVWHDVTDRTTAERALRESADEMRRLSQHIQEAREDEQMRIARELHDRLGQSLTMLKIGIARLTTRLKTARADVRELGAELLVDIDSTIRAMREISQHIRPPMLDDLGIAAALGWAARRFTDRTGVSCKVSGQVEHVPAEVGRALYAIATEALTNVARHADATAVSIDVRRRNGDFVVTVRDDGKGFDVQADDATKALGLVGMRERAAAEGGTLRIQSAPGAGTTVEATIPDRQQ